MNAIDDMSTGGIAALALVEQLGTPPFDVGPYRCDERIGLGASAEVLRARDTRLEESEEDAEDVAVKRLLPGIAPTREPERARAVRHPGVAALLDFGTDESTGRQYLVYEFVQGETLLDAREHDSWTPKRAAEIVAAVARAAAAAHARGVIHGDLKPDNIILTETGPKVIDLGSASRGQGEAPCAKGFGSPEQLRGESATTASDVYALGRILRWLSPDLPRTLAAIADRATSSIPAERQQFARELAGDLEAYLAHRPVEWTKPGVRRVWLFARRSPVPAALIVVAAVLSLLAASAMLEARLESKLNELREQTAGQSLAASARTVEMIENVTRGSERNDADPEWLLSQLSDILLKDPRFALQVEAVMLAAEVDHASILAAKERRSIPRPQAEALDTALLELDARLQEHAPGGVAHRKVISALGCLTHPTHLNDVERWSAYGQRLMRMFDEARAAAEAAAEAEGG